MLFPDVVKAILDLGFPIVVAVFLMIRLESKIDKFIQKEHETKIGLYLIMDRLNVVKEYDEAVGEYRARREKKDE